MKALEPISIAGVEIPNRVVRTAHSTHFGSGGIVPSLIDYHVERARGGVGLTILEIAGVHPTCPSSICNFDDSVIEGYEQLMRAIRPHGMRVFQQLWHAGHNGVPIDGSPPWSSCDLPSPVLGMVPIAMSQFQIREMVEAFAAAAERCQRGGVDGVELHGSHGYLPQQFMSAMLNRREDEYGGSFENRMRFTVEVLAAIREQVGPGYPVGIRLSPEIVEGGMTPEETARAASYLEERGLIDFLDVSMGGYFAFPKMIGGMFEPAGYELATSAPVTAAVKVPRIVTGRFRTLEEVSQVIAEGTADLVGMTRAHIADAAIVRKSREGREAEIRPCIGCNQGCVGMLLGPERRMGCTVNPYIGREGEVSDDRLPPADVKRTVLVIGGGPAGMEAARVSRLRGHNVILAEAAPQLGGQVRIAALAPRHQGIGDYTLWQEAEIYRLGVDVRLSTYLDGGDADAFGADRIIVATGSSPRVDGVQMAIPARPMKGIEHPDAISSIDFFSGRHNSCPASAIVVDDVGHYEGIAVAEALIERGSDVTFVTRHKSFAHLLESALQPEPALQRLNRGSFRLHLRSHVDSFNGSEAVISDLNGGGTSTVRADWAVMVSHNRPAIEPFADLLGTRSDIAIVGDANSPRFLLRAIAEGNRAGCMA